MSTKSKLVKAVNNAEKLYKKVKANPQNSDYYKAEYNTEIGMNEITAIEPRCFVRRLEDGKVLPAIAECGDEICVVELFEFADGVVSPRPLKLWHPKSRYVTIIDEN
jgi:hypothetical protein